MDRFRVYLFIDIAPDLPSNAANFIHSN